MTHEELRLKAVAWLKRGYVLRNGKNVSGPSCSVVLSEMTSAAGEIPDAIGWCYGHSHLVECKVSRSDFLADAQKAHRKVGGTGETRWFLTPAGMLTADEIPANWGLLELNGRSIVRTKEATKSDLDVTGYRNERLMLLSALGRIRMREFLIISREQCDIALGDFDEEDDAQPI